MAGESTVMLYRPVGQKEMDLIHESGDREFPPRLRSQPIFYPVLNEAYAVQIARDWNTKDEASGHVGYFTRFRVRSGFLDRYPVQTVGSSSDISTLDPNHVRPNMGIPVWRGVWFPLS